MDYEDLDEIKERVSNRCVFYGTNYGNFGWQDVYVLKIKETTDYSKKFRGYTETETELEVYHIGSKEREWLHISDFFNRYTMSK